MNKPIVKPNRIAIKNAIFNSVEIEDEIVSACHDPTWKEALYTTWHVTRNATEIGIDQELENE